MPSNCLHCGLLLLAHYCYFTGAQIALQPAIVEPKFSGSSDSEICTSETSCSQLSQIESEVKASMKVSLSSSLEFTDIFQQAHVQTFIKATHLASTG